MALDLDEVPVPRAMSRPDLLAGCERQLFLLTALVCTTLIVVIQTWVAVTAGVLVWIVTIGVLRRAAKSDPFMSKVYARHTKYRAFYGARSTPWAESARRKRD